MDAKRTPQGGTIASEFTLDDTGERGAEPKYGPDHDARILALLDQKPPAGYANWTGPLLTKALGDIHVQHVWRFLRAQKIDLSGRKSWCESDDPDFVAKAAEIVGLYMAPPDGPSFWRSTKSHRSRRSNARKATSNCRTGAP